MDTGVGQREHGHDYEARPRVQTVLQPLVGGDRRGEAAPGGVGKLRGGLLAEGSGKLGGALEVATHRPVRSRNQADRKTGNDRVHTRVKHGQPDSDSEERRGGSSPGSGETQKGEEGEQREGGQSDERDVLGVCEGDDEQRAEVIYHREREEEDPQPRCRRAHQGERPEG